MFPIDELNGFLEQAEEHGFVDERELESIAVEHELDDDELAALRAELEVARRRDRRPKRPTLELGVGPGRGRDDRLR